MKRRFPQIDDFISALSICQKWGKKNLAIKYIPNYIPKNHPWYERDGLMTYIEQLKYKKFKENRDSHFKNTEIVNFDIINHQCRGECLQNSKKYYTAITKKTLNIILMKKKNLLSMLLKELHAAFSGFKEI